MEEKTVRQYLIRKGYGENVIKKIMNPDKKVRSYTKPEICTSLVIHSISPKAYNTMRQNSLTIIPLPHPRTLRRHISHFICAPGLQREFFELLGHRLSAEDFFGRQAVVLFDELHVRECYEYDRRLMTVYGPNKKLQVVMIR